MLVTVYITNYNYCEFIRQAIDSVLAQTLTDYELLIIDDGSTDNSKEIIEEYRGLPNVTIIYQQNKGLNATNNIAMHAAKGQYLMRLDADDFLSPNALEVMSERLNKEAELGFVFPDYYYTDKQGNVIGEQRRHNFNNDVSLYDQPAHGACTMIRLNFLRDLGGYNERFSCQDGYDLWIKFIRHHKVSNINQPLFYYRRHDKNLTRHEAKILRTRRQIKDSFVASNKIRTPTTVAVIQAERIVIGENNWPLYVVNGKTILQTLIETVLESDRIQLLVVTTGDKEILDHLRSFSNDYNRLLTLHLPNHTAANGSLIQLFDFVLQTVISKGIVPEALMSVSIRHPNLTKQVLDEAINTLAIFNADSLLSVRSEDSMFYKHKGHGMVSILKGDIFTKIEEEAVYRAAGGIMLTLVDSFLKQRRLLGGKVTHIMVDEKTAFEVNSEFELVIFKAIAAGVENNHVLLHQNRHAERAAKGLVQGGA